MNRTAVGRLEPVQVCFLFSPWTSTRPASAGAGFFSCPHNRQKRRHRGGPSPASEPGTTRPPAASQTERNGFSGL